MFIKQPATKKSLAFRKPILGVGTNDSWYMIEYINMDGKRITCPYYRVWTNMLERCFSKKLHALHPSYSDCSTTKEWLLFSTFRLWMEKQNWKDKQLDKDIISYGNKKYAPHLCLFVDSHINTLLINCSRSRGDLPQGVIYRKPNNKFQARCRVFGKSKNIGSYNTSEEASEAYKIFKSNHISSVAEQYKSEPRLYEALKNHARLMLL